MKSLVAFLLIFAAVVAVAQKPDTRYFEIRSYYAAAGKLDALNQRFRGNTTRIFEKHGMENIIYWVPVTNDKNMMMYILAFPSKEARKKSWENFIADPEWKEVASKSEVNGKLLDSIKSVFMTPTDLLPATINGVSTPADRIYELRTYTCLPGRLPNLLNRFRNHTIKLFEKHGITNVAYFVSEEPEGKQSKLVYLLAHQNVDAATKSWAAFRADPDWIKAKEDSEKDGKIVEKVETIYLKTLDFSKLK